jgi:hypothetical protein
VGEDRRGAHQGDFTLMLGCMGTGQGGEGAPLSLQPCCANCFARDQGSWTAAWVGVFA